MATQTQTSTTLAPLKTVTALAPLNRPLARVLPASSKQKPINKYMGDVEVKYLYGSPSSERKVAGSTVSDSKKTVSEVKVKNVQTVAVPTEKKAPLVKDNAVTPTIVVPTVTKMKMGINPHSVTVPTQRLDATVKQLTDPGTKKASVLKAADTDYVGSTVGGSKLVGQATVKDIDDYNLSFAYGMYRDEKDPVNTPFDKTFRPLLKGKNEPVLVNQPNFMPLGQSHVGGVYGTDRFKYNDQVKKVQLLNTTN